MTVDAVTGSLVCENLCVVDYTVDHGCGDLFGRQAFTPSPKSSDSGVIINDAFSFLVDTN